MGATVLSKDKEEQRIYIVLLIEVPRCGSSIFSVFHTRTHKQTKGRANTHARSDSHGQSICHALSLLNADDARVDGLLVAWFTEKGPSNECISTSCRTMSDREVNN